MKIVAAQLNTLIGDITYNKEKITKSIRSAKQQGADLIVFGELALCGYPVYDLVQSEDMLNACGNALEEIVKHSDGIAVLVGLPRKIGYNFYNAAAYIRNGELCGYIYKTRVTSRDEKDFFTEACFNDHTILLNGDKLLITIGKEYETMKADKTHSLTINMGAFPFCHGIIKENLVSFSKISLETSVPFIHVNHAGGQADLIYHGASAALNGNGQLLGISKAFEEDLLTVDLDRMNEPVPFPPESADTKIQQVHHAIITGLRDYFGKNGFTKACLGLSGGVDSAVAAALATEALGAENVHVLLMPSQFSSPHSVADAVSMAENLRIRHDIIPIEPVYNEFMQNLSGLFNDLPFDLAEENLQARIRGVLLMALSNKFGYVLLNTFNKSEAAMGYGTLYGDTNGGVSMLGDLYKTEVYGLARYINRHGEVIPHRIIQKEPSAELRPDQKDSDTLPPYSELDKILYLLIEKNRSPERVVSEGFPVENVEKAALRLRLSEYKRYQLPPSFRLSRRTLGIDRIIPIVSK